jgi:hypothetical protein
VVRKGTLSSNVIAVEGTLSPAFAKAFPLLSSFIGKIPEKSQEARNESFGCVNLLWQHAMHVNSFVGRAQTNRLPINPIEAQTTRRQNFGNVSVKSKAIDAWMQRAAEC